MFDFSLRGFALVVRGQRISGRQFLCGVRQYLIQCASVLIVSVLCLSAPLVHGAENVTPPTFGSCSSATEPMEPGSTPVLPGRWWNPERWGTGWDLNFLHDDTLVLNWYTFDRDSRPVWLTTDAAPVSEDGLRWSAALFKYRWINGSRSDGERVGSVALSFSAADPSRAAIRWQWDEVDANARTECIRDFSRLGPTPQGANTALSGEWYEPTKSGWGASISIVPLPQADGAPAKYYEGGAIRIYDDAGEPVWLTINHLPDDEGATSSPPAMGQWRGFDMFYGRPDEDRVVPTTSCDDDTCVTFADAGNFSRKYISTLAMHATVEANGTAAVVGEAVTFESFDRPDPGAEHAVLSRISALDKVLVDRLDCTVPAGHSTCAITIDWSADPAHSAPTVFRIDVNTGNALVVGNGAHGEYIDELAPGAHVQYELHETGTRDDTPLSKTPGVQAYGSSLPAPSSVSVDRQQCQVSDGDTCDVLVVWQTDAVAYPSASVFRLDLVTGTRTLLRSSDTQGQLFDSLPGSTRTRYELRAHNAATSELLASSAEVRVRTVSQLVAEPGSCMVAPGGECEIHTRWAVDSIDHPGAALFLRDLASGTAQFLIQAARGERFEPLPVGTYRYEVRASGDPASALVVASNEIDVQEEVVLPPLVDAPDPAECAGPPLDLAPGTTPAFPGTWYNPDRNGTGWHLLFGDDGRLTVYWFTFSRDRHPVWLESEPMSVDPQSAFPLGQGTYRSYLREYRWSDGTRDQGRVVGSVALTFVDDDPTRAAVRWQWNEVGTAPAEGECIKDFLRPAPTPEPQNLTMAFTGKWHEDAEAPGHWPDYPLLLSVMPYGEDRFIESTTLAIFDDFGRATWLFSEPLVYSLPPEPGTSAGFDLDFVIPNADGYPEGVPVNDCTSEQVCKDHLPAGTFTRAYQSSVTMSARIEPTRGDLSDFRRPAADGGTVTFVKEGAKNLVMLDRVDCTVPRGGETCPIRVAWSATREQEGATLFRYHLNSDSQSLVGSGQSGEFTDALHAGDKVYYVLRTSASPSATELFRTIEVRAFGAAPLVEIVYPHAGKEFAAPATFIVETETTDPSIALARVDILLNGQVECGTDQPPYACEVRDLAPGNYEIVAEARDTSGVVTRSAPVMVTVYRVPVPPTVRLTAPAEGATTEAPGTFHLSAEARDELAIDRVVFYANGSPIHTTSTPTQLSSTSTGIVATYEYVWRNVPEGEHELTARAYDSDGLPADSGAPILVTAYASAPVDLPAPDLASDRVGATAGQFRVDEAGAATYSIPLYVAPGTAGVVPQIALAYSSQGGVGPLGKGWSIQGTSSIMRCRKSREAGDSIVDGNPLDSSAPAITFGSEDAFCLDGQRLLEVSNTGAAACPARAGALVQQFRTEIESFQRVCAYSPVPADGPRYFTVERKDGSLSWYGDRRSATPSEGEHAPHGYITANGTGQESRTFLWAQTRFQDSTGNYIDYRYQGDPAGEDRPGEQLLVEVAFTGKLVLPGQDGTALAPYAALRFEYETLPADQHAAAYVSGSQFWRSQRLARIHSTSGGETLRFYDLEYRTSLSGTGASLLHSLKECRDASLTVCLEPTAFKWSEARQGFGPEARTEQIDHGSLTKFEGLKFGDVDGDGLRDLVWIKDGTPDDRPGCTTDSIYVAFGELNNRGVPAYKVRGKELCTQAELEEWGEQQPDSSWFLLDYDGDGKDDVFYRTAQGWRGFASTGVPRGNQPVFDRNDLLASIAPAIPGGSSLDHAPQLADLNGDGLTDIVYFRDGEIVARIMERNDGSFGWGRERTIEYAPALEPCAGLANNCRWEIAGLYRKANYQQLNDFNGDARADLLAVIDVTRDVQCPTHPPGDPQPPVKPRQMDGRTPAGAVCVVPWVYALTVSRLEPGHVEVDPYPGGRWANAYLDAVSFVDINGDGLTDILNHNEFFFIPVFQLNLGNAFKSTVTPVLDGGHVWTPQLQVSDVNGDGRADVVYPHQRANGSGFDRFVMRAGRGDGSFGPEQSIPGDPSTACSDKDCMLERSYLFGDHDADGVLDFLRIEWGGSSADVFIARADQASRATPRDTITRITNGLGAITDLTYRPLTNGAIYRAGAGSRALEFGRGSPAQDVLAPMYVVAKASSSAPVDGDPNAMSSLYYRYVGARMQAGGRGSLGFSEIHTIDPNHQNKWVLSISHYRQDFPYIGRPLATEKRVINGPFRADSCLDGITDQCFVGRGASFDAPNGNVRYLSASYSTWESPNYDPGAQRPVHVQLAGSVDVSYDPDGGDVLKRVDTTFQYDNWGNATFSETRTYDTDFAAGEAPTASAATSTISQFDNHTREWRLGRLRTSTVTHQRPGQAPVQRTTEFAYAMAPAATGLLTMERVQPRGGSAQDLRTFHVLDAFGNRLRSHTCSAELSDAECKSTAIVFQPDDPLSIQRYERQVYDARGRFAVSSHAPFWNGFSATEHATAVVLSRNVFGEPTYTQDVNGVASAAVFGNLGRPYVQWRQTGLYGEGVLTHSTYRWCGTVPCPAGARYREQVATTGAPTTWTYFDVLGRPMLRVGAGFNAGVAGMEFSAVCSRYDARSRETQRSEPFFLTVPAQGGAPAFAGDPCATAWWTTTSFDVLDRPTTITAPDSGTTQFAYDGRITTITDPLGHERSETSNALGERVRAMDAGGLETVYGYDATGNLTSVTRDGGRGDITTRMQYDTLGRKIAMQDPDAGRWTYGYNAAGELVLQSAASGDRVEQQYDARGRVHTKQVRTSTALETTQTTVYDTAAHGLGQRASEAIAGTYAAWQSLPTGHGLSHAFARSFIYDAMGRLDTTHTTISGVEHTTQTRYDALGRAFLQQDASGHWLETDYDERGFVRALCEAQESDVGDGCASGASGTYLETLETDARGKVVWERRGGTAALELERTFDPATGRLTRLCAGSNCAIQEEDYHWDQAGNLEWRDKAGQYREAFTYDPLHRLIEARYERVLSDTWAPGTGPVSLAVQYDTLGNICSKTIDGTAQYYDYAGAAGCGRGGLPGSGRANGGSPHAVAGVGGTGYHYDAQGNQVLADAPGSAADRTIRYTAEQQAHEILVGSPSAPSQRARFWYGPGGQRYLREDYAPGETTKRTLYLGNVEVLQQGGLVTMKRYVAGVLVQEIQAGIATTKYLFGDHLGSIVRVTDAAGTLLEGMDYGPFGERRGYVDPRGLPTFPQATNRGFTGHEMLDGPDIVHMNGRIYDSRIARFLQPDPIIQEPGNPQNFNRYTYLWNNPLNGTDPSGYLGVSERQWLGVIITIVAVATQQYWAAGFTEAYAVGYTALVYAGVGAASGAISTQSWSGAAWGAFSGLVFGGLGGHLQNASPWVRGLSMGSAGGVLSVMQGGKFGHGFVSAGVGAALGPKIGRIGNDVGRTVVAALVGGTVSVATGGKFANGAITSTMASVLHRAVRREVTGQYSSRKLKQLERDEHRVSGNLEGAKSLARAAIADYSARSAAHAQFADLDLFTTKEFDAMNVSVNTEDVPKWALSDESFTVSAAYDPNAHAVELFAKGLALNGETSMRALAKVLVHEFGHGTVSGRQAYADFNRMPRQANPVHARLPHEINSNQWVNEVFP